MSRFPGLRRFMRLDRGTRGVERAVDDELQFHFDMTVAELRALGLDDDAAQREAKRRFGDVARTRERLTQLDRARVGGAQRAEWLGAVRQDLRYALRGIRLRPGFAFAVILTLGLGIGANATMYGIIDRLMFRTPRYLATPDRIHKVYFNRDGAGRETFSASESFARFRDFRSSVRTADLVVGYSQGRFAIGNGANSHEVNTGAASANFWQLFNARPALGRFFDASDDRDGDGAHVAVLSYEFWQSEFAGSRAVLGQTIHLRTHRYTIIGVTPPGFTGLRMVGADVMLPLSTWTWDSFGSEWIVGLNRYNEGLLTIFVRRRADVSAEATEADLNEAFRRSVAIQESLHRGRRFVTSKPHALAGSIIEQRRPGGASATTKVAAWLFGVACIVLLIASANVGNLLLGRALARRREIGVRLALGVSRARLVSQLLIDSCLLALLGGLAGLAVAQWGGQLLRRSLLAGLPFDDAITDTRVLAFTAACALTSGVLAGLAPILQTRRIDVAATLQAGGARGGAARSRLRGGLLVVQTALSVVLLVGAGLFGRSVMTLSATPLGYDADRLLWLEPRMRGEKLDSLQEIALHNALLARAHSLPEAENASLVATVPFNMSFYDNLFVVNDDGSTQHMKDATLQVASPSYFATAGTHIRRGRAFTTADVFGAPLVAIVSEQFARRAWPNQDPIGRCVRMTADTMPCRRIVGVAEDVRLVGDLAAAPDPIYYFPVTQHDVSSGNLYVRVRGSVEANAEAIRRALQTVMPGASYLVATPVAETIAPVTSSWWLGATMFAVFGALALVLATIGLYSVVAYSVTQRTHEMGVRIALGARVADILSLVVGDGVRLVLVGVGCGAAVALIGGRWIAPLLFKVSPIDGFVFSTVAVAMLAVGALASGIPALRASRIDPAVALRAD
ncbi:MAG TPA: ABC transporter permease [Gemmatimonadaceae bacterium]|jgi:predicted permease